MDFGRQSHISGMKVNKNPLKHIVAVPDFGFFDNKNQDSPDGFYGWKL